MSSRADQHEEADKATRLLAVDKALAESEQWLRMAIEAGKIGLWVWDSTRITNPGDWSPRLREIYPPVACPTMMPSL